MPHFRKRLAHAPLALRWCRPHFYATPLVTSTYPVRDDSVALDIEADVGGNNVINAGVDVMHILRAFANEVADGNELF